VSAQNITPEQKKALEEVATYVASQLRSGVAREQIVQSLVERGVNTQLAQNIVNEVSRGGAARMSNARSSATRAMVIGAVICIIGLVVTIGSYSAASTSPGGGRYVIAWGAVIFGGLQFVRGLIAYLGSR
jgi:hypothetical protein